MLRGMAVEDRRTRGEIREQEKEQDQEQEED